MCCHNGVGSYNVVAFVDEVKKFSSQRRQRAHRLLHHSSRTMKSIFSVAQIGLH